MIYFSNKSFTTKDVDNNLSSRNCSLWFKGAWWLKLCRRSNLDGLYHGGSFNDSYADGVSWNSFRGHLYSLKRTEVKVRSLN